MRILPKETIEFSKPKRRKIYILRETNSIVKYVKCLRILLNFND